MTLKKFSGGDKEIWINIETISSIQPNFDQTDSNITIICMLDGKSHNVRETVTEILSILTTSSFANTRQILSS